MRDFAMVACSVAQSQKLRKLDHKGRWAYLCALASPFAGYTGLFRYPLGLWADDAELSTEELQERIGAMQDVNLIDWDAESQTLRIDRWWRVHVPSNADMAVSRIKDIERAEALPMQAACLAEFVFALWPQMATWQDKSREKVNTFLGYAIETVGYDNPEELENAVLAEAKRAKSWVISDLSAYFPALSDHHADTLSTPSRHGATIERGRERGERKEKERESRKAAEPRKGPSPELLAIVRKGREYV